MTTKNIIKNLLLIYLLVVTAELKAQFTYTKENGTIPPDFGKTENEVLICVLHSQNAYNKYLIKNVEKNYFGKYIFVPYDDRYSTKYTDTTVYKYMFDMSEESHTSNGATIYGRTFFMIDRNTHKRYGNNTTSGLWGKMIIAYMTGLEKVRLENQGKK